jgi:hypothetical protein
MVQALEEGRLADVLRWARHPRRPTDNDALEPVWNAALAAGDLAGVINVLSPLGSPVFSPTCLNRAFDSQDISTDESLVGLLEAYPLMREREIIVTRLASLPVSRTGPSPLLDRALAVFGQEGEDPSALGRILASLVGNAQHVHPDLSNPWTASGTPAPLSPGFLAVARKGAPLDYSHLRFLRRYNAGFAGHILGHLEAEGLLWEGCMETMYEDTELEARKVAGILRARHQQAGLQDALPEAGKAPAPRRAL